ncbi:MAG: hypothetical protein ACYS47_16255, partial [Planctomycetota bacterium]
MNEEGGTRTSGTAEAGSGASTLETVGQFLLIVLAVAHPALYGWLPGFADGRATIDLSLAELLLIVPSLALLPLAAACLALRGGTFRFATTLPFLFGGLLLAWVL